MAEVMCRTSSRQRNGSIASACGVDGARQRSGAAGSSVIGSACQSSCQANSIVAYTCPPNGIQDAAYATPEGTVLKFDGTLWKASSAVPTQIIGIAGVALTQ